MAFGQEDGWERAIPERSLPEVDGRTVVVRAYTAIGMGLLGLASIGGWYVGWLPVACVYSALFYFSLRTYDNEHDSDSPTH